MPAAARARLSRTRSRRSARRGRVHDRRGLRDCSSGTSATGKRVSTECARQVVGWSRGRRGPSDRVEAESKLIVPVWSCSGQSCPARAERQCAACVCACVLRACASASVWREGVERAPRKRGQYSVSTCARAHDMCGQEMTALRGESGLVRLQEIDDLSSARAAWRRVGEAGRIGYLEA